MDVELFDSHFGKAEDIHSRLASIAIRIMRAFHVVTEGPGRQRQAVNGPGREFDVRLSCDGC